MLAFPIDEFGILFLSLNLTELDFDGSPGDDSFSFGEDLLANDTFEEGAFAWIMDDLPVDWEPTTAIMGRLTSRLTSDRRMIS